MGEAVRGSRLHLGSHDCRRLPRRDDHPGSVRHPLGLLVLLHARLRLHRVHPSQGSDGAQAKEIANDDAMAGGRTEKVAPLIHLAKVMTVISWCTYPVVYIFPMMGMEGAQAVVGIQVGYCVSDIISKCGVGLLTYRICVAKSGRQ